MKYAWLLFISSCVITLSACVTVSNEPEQRKWTPAERAEIHVNLGMDYLKRGQTETARDEFDLAISIDSTSDQAHHAMGLLFAQTGFESEALKSFSKAVSLNRSNYTAVNDYGTLLCQNGQTEEGLKQLVQIVDSTENTAIVATNLALGLCYKNAGQYQNAKKRYHMVLDVVPTLGQALYPMSDIAYKEKRYLSARAFIERYFSVEVLGEKALVLGAKIELTLKDKAKALQYYQELSRLYPKSKYLKELAKEVQ